ncbi:hypothetical protein LZZ90_13980 [Flavobacterium sp. SM15]|uniref:hypothetical protein n=1 Tax=Flavobacterium sp. SM15 TaxID=2908005 RepID=UPI001EDC2B74|nr:hypothetical protein [Flavobacterium sp. SM15]MCG2612614.1 hypothetical protein [Flavobacterium sp. SM15]
MITKNEQNEEVSNFEIFEKQKIYSERSVWGFSLFFTTLFGGILLMQNLKDIGKKKEANNILVMSILYSIISIIIVNIPDNTNPSLAISLNVFGGMLLSKYYFPKYFPKTENYEKKPIWKPLIISLIVAVPFVFALFFA